MCTSNIGYASKLARVKLSLAHSTGVTTDMPEKYEKQLEWSQSGGWKGRTMEEMVQICGEDDY